ncbi:YhcH/YjgK/YiaL family protein [Klebsiella pneumoniae]|uniref:YhcH/YjgK/YiaL family protein n=1 Tax=Klebsiella pneumoniae TaxID=573 RepID=UPI003AF9F4EB
MIISNISQTNDSVAIRSILSHPDLSPERTQQLKPGKYFPSGEDWYFMVIEGETGEPSSNEPEFHKQYADIQILMSGTETIEFCIQPLTDTEINTTESQPDLFFIPSREVKSWIILKEGDYAVFYPGEVHKPMCNTEGVSHHVRKVVVKFPCENFIG